jgi:hypothetical protein
MPGLKTSLSAEIRFPSDSVLALRGLQAWTAEKQGIEFHGRLLQAEMHLKN